MNPPVHEGAGRAAWAPLFDERRLARELATWLEISSRSIRDVCIDRCWPARAGAFRFQWSFARRDARRFNLYGTPANELPADFVPALHRPRFTRAGLRGVQRLDAAERLLIHSVDCDPGLPRLRAALRGGEMRGALARARSDGGARTLPLTCELLAYKSGRRAAIRYAWGADGRRCVLGKIHRDGGGDELAARHAALAARFTAETGGKIAVPSMVGQVPALGMLLFEWLPGTSIGDDGLPDVAALRGAIDALVTLHGATLPDLPLFTADDELRVVERWCSALAAVHPERPAAPVKLLGTLRGMRPAITDGPLCLVHRDFYGKQVLRDGPRTTLLDLDTLSRGRAEQDLANIGAHLHLNAAQDQKNAAAAERIFEAAQRHYEYRTGPLDRPALRFFLTAALTRLGAVHALRTRTRRCSEALWDAARRLAAEPVCRAAPARQRRALVRT